MKKLALALAAALALATAANAAPVKVGIAAEPYPPFASPDAAGNWTGWEVDIIKAVCKAAEMDCAITPVAWDGIIPSLTGGQIDAIMASMSITDERKKVIDFSDKYYNTPTVIVAAKGSGLKPTPESLKGKVIGAQVATIHEAYIKAHFPDAVGAFILPPSLSELERRLEAWALRRTRAEIAAASKGFGLALGPVWTPTELLADAQYRARDFIQEDGASDWPTFAEKSKKLLVNDRVAAVFGCWTSASRKAVLPVFEKENGMLYYPTFYEGLEQSKNVIYTGQEATQQIIWGLDWGAKEKKAKTFFLIGSDYIWPRTSNKIARKHIENFQKGKVVGEEYYPLGHTNFNSLINKIKVAKPDCVYARKRALLER